MSLSLHRHVFVEGASPAAPVLLLLHGTGGDERSLMPFGKSLLPGAHLLSPRGKVSEGGALRFFRRHAEGVFDIPDLIDRASDLAAFVVAAKAHYGVTGSRVLALGYSNGANIAGGLLLGRPGLLSAAALWRPMLPYDPADLPGPPAAWAGQSAPLAGVDVLLTFGVHDPITPPEHRTTYPALLRRLGAAPEVHTLQAAHGLTQEDLDLTQTFLTRATTTV